MIDNDVLAELLFPQIHQTPSDIEARYPARQLPEGAKVTRFAPSPTGYVHFGGLFPSTVGERLAHQSNGIFYLRIEDTDARREVDGAAAGLIRTLARYGVHFDEGATLGDDGQITDQGAYGPYRQSLRGEIYQTYAKQLVREGKAYPCFSTEAELEEIQNADKKAMIAAKDWHTAEDQRAEMIAQRNFTLEEVKHHLDAGDPFVLRILADGDPKKKLPFTDLIKGKLEIPENDEDFVLLKSNGIPTYHFAHAVDDHLMGTTHVIRGEEWLPSLAKHLQLFRYLGFRVPKYMHIAQILRLDESGNKKKLSKRDMGANMEDYRRMGYDPACVIEYVMTLLNSNYEEWHAANPTLPYTDFPFSIKKMSTSGCLFDFDKLNDVSKNVISRMTADEVYSKVTQWAKEFDPEFCAHLTANPDFARAIFAIGRGGKKPRKDFATWSEVKNYMGFFYNDYFQIESKIPDRLDPADEKKALEAFLETYNPQDDNTVWFEKVKAICPLLGYTDDMKAFRQTPDAFRGNVGDISNFIRIAVTGRDNSPDLNEIMRILGENVVRQRICNRIHSL